MTPDITQGESGDLVSQLTDYLFRLGYLPAAKNSFDDAVTQAVKAFQQARGLTISGIVDAITLRSLEEARWKLGDRTLSLVEPPMRGDDVAHLQSQLSEMGFNCGRVDGIFGGNTETALKEFQKSVGVKVDGQCGPATVMSMMRLMKIVSGGAPIQLRDEVNRTGKGPALAGKVIVLDPAGLPEIFDLAQRLEGRLIALGINVFMTRNAQTNPSEQERIESANNSTPDLVISLRQDEYPNETAHGVATYYYGSESHGIHSIVGERFANLVQREICARTDLLNCRTHAKTWDILRLTKSPTVRIDLGYHSNPGDSKKIADPAFRETLVEAMLIAIQRLYLSSENDAKTGTLKVSDLRRAGLRK
ncbi:MAG: peptidoglycan-binding protein [Actinomycetes bacterium]